MSCAAAAAIARPLAHLLCVLATILDEEGVDLLDGMPQLVVRVVGRQLQLCDEPVHLRISGCYA